MLQTLQQNEPQRPDVSESILKKRSTRLLSALFMLLALCSSHLVSAQTPQFFKTGTGTSGNTIPLNQASQKTQLLYAPGDFNTTPISGLITKIYFRNSAAGATATYSDFQVSFIQNNDPSFPNSTFLTGLTVAHFASTQTVNANTVAGGWFEIPLNTPFLYDNTKSLIVEIQYTARTGGISTTTSTSTGNKRRSGTSLTATTGTTNTTHNDFGMDVIPNTPCTAPPTAGTASASATTICANNNFTLNLTGNSIGSGQTYQWETSANGTSGWTATGTAGVSPFLSTTQGAGTNFYRAAVTCSGQTSFSNVISVTTAALISGTFTINNAAPASATNFTTFSDAVNILNCAGVSGPVTFNVSAGQTFTEDVPEITAAGTLANPIIFQKSGTGANPEIRPTGTSAANEAGIAIVGGDYFTFDGIDITIATGSALEYGYAVRNATSTNGASNNTIKNAKITLNSANTNSVGVIQTSSTTGGGQSATSPNGANQHNSYSNLVIENAYAGMHFISGASTIFDAHTQVFNNTIGGTTAATGIGNTTSTTANYGIKATFQNAIKIYNNVIRNVSNNGGLLDGIFIDRSYGTTDIYNNRIHGLTRGGTTIGTATSALYGIRVIHTGTVGSGHVTNVYNNVVYDLNRPFAGTASAIRGIVGIAVQTGGTGGSHNISFNTVHIEPAAAYTGSSTAFEVATTATGPAIRVLNNSFTNFMGAQTGVAKHYAFVNTVAASAIPAGSISNYNNLYVANTTNGFTGLNGTVDVPTLAGWQAANGGAFDQNSVSADPAFVNLAGGNLQPTNVTLNNAGQPVTGITTDITGAARHATTPDIGAYEFIVAAMDLGATALVTPVTKVCYSNAEPVTVTIKNWGTTAIDFSALTATVTVNVTGAITQTLSATITNAMNGGQPLAAGATINVPVGNLNMTTAGTYTFNATTAITTGGTDGNPANDAMAAVTITTVPVTAGTITATNTTLCQSGTTTLNISGNAGGGIQWQQSSSATGPFTNISGATGTSFTPTAPLTATTHYRAVVTCGSNTANSNVVTVTVNNPSIIASAGASRCGSGPVTLSATPSAGATINWYDAATGGALVSTGATYSPTVSATTTYYAASSLGGSTFNVGPVSNAIGAGAASSLTHYTIFDALSAFTLDHVYVYPGAAGNVVLHLSNSAGTVLQTFTLPVTTADVGQKTLIPINYPIAPGTGYRLGWSSGGVSLFRNTAGATFPYTVPGVISLTGTSFTGYPQYYYYIYDIQVTNGCESARTPVVATVNPAPAVNLGADVAICGATPVVLDAGNAGATFQWSLNGTAIPGATSQTLSVTTAGTYAVTVTNAANCTGTDDVVVTVGTAPATPTITVAAGGNTTICAGSSVTLTGATTTTGATFAWSRNGTAIAGATSATYTATQAGSYTVTATSTGCSSTSAATTVTVNPKPATPTITKSGNMLTSSATTGTYQWYSVSGTTLTLVTGATSQTFTPTVNGNYTVRVTVNGCESDAPTAMNVVLGISSLAPGMDVSVYPNPSAGRFTVNLTGFEKEASIQIINVTGQVITSEKVAITSDKASKAFDLGGMAKGVYILKVTSGNNLTFRKMILD